MPRCRLERQGATRDVCPSGRGDGRPRVGRGPGEDLGRLQVLVAPRTRVAAAGLVGPPQALRPVPPDDLADLVQGEAEQRPELGRHDHVVAELVELALEAVRAPLEAVGEGDVEAPLLDLPPIEPDVVHDVLQVQLDAPGEPGLRLVVLVPRHPPDRGERQDQGLRLEPSPHSVLHLLVITPLLALPGSHARDLVRPAHGLGVVLRDERRHPVVAVDQEHPTLELAGHVASSLPGFGCRSEWLPP